MIGNCFVSQIATEQILSNVTNFCSKCYTEILKDETIFYDMKNCCYFCETCQEVLAENLDINCESITTEGNSLFS